MGFLVFSVGLLPPSSCHQAIATNQFSTTNCQQPILINQLSTSNFQEPIFNNQLSTTNCHQPTVINQLSSTSSRPPIVTNQCHQPIVINQWSPTNCHQPIATNDLLATCLLQGVGCTPRRWLALLGLRRCSAVICVRGSKRCVLQGFVGVEDPQFGQWRNAKTVGFTRVVSVVRAGGAGRACVIGSFESWARVNANGAKCTPR